MARTVFKGVLRGPFDVERRAEAGLHEDWYMPLTKPVEEAGGAESAPDVVGTGAAAGAGDALAGAGGAGAGTEGATESGRGEASAPVAGAVDGESSAPAEAEVPTAKQ